MDHSLSCEEGAIIGQGEKLISVKHFAKICSMSERAIWRHLASGKLPKPIKVGRCTRFFMSDVLRWFDMLKEQQA